MRIPLLITWSSSSSIPSAGISRGLPACTELGHAHKLAARVQKCGHQGRVHNICSRMSQVLGFTLQSVAPFVTRYCVDVGKGVWESVWENIKEWKRDSGMAVCVSKNGAFGDLKPKLRAREMLPLSWRLIAGSRWLRGLHVNNSTNTPCCGHHMARCEL